MLCFTVLSTICLFYTVSASPVLDYNILLSRAGNTTSHIPSAWVNEPDGRGTYSLLFSCFSTLFLCAWTAFHPNVPSTHSAVKNLIERVKWMMVAIFVPEAVLYCAWSQWWVATDLKNEVNRLGQQSGLQKTNTTFTKKDRMDCESCMKLQCQSDRRESSESNAQTSNQGRQSQETASLADHSHGSSTSRDNACQIGVQDGFAETSKTFIPWTTEQAFFAISGGLAVDTSRISDRPWMALNPKGVVFFAEIGLLPRILKQDVEDLSQADAIAKSISCLQSLWFFIQTIVRRFAGLPITLIEIHTMIHIVCALLMYGLWFKKLIVWRRQYHSAIKLQSILLL